MTLIEVFQAVLQVDDSPDSDGGADAQLLTGWLWSSEFVVTSCLCSFFYPFSTVVVLLGLACSRPFEFVGIFGLLPQADHDNPGGVGQGPDL